MFVSLTRTMRLRAGWFIAFAYLLCVLAPTLSYALPGEHAVALCLTDEDHVPGMTHVHTQIAVQHVHEDGHVHDHIGGHAKSGNERSTLVALNGQSVPEKAPHSDSQCCGLMCVTALPATLSDVVTPSASMALRAADGYLEVADNAPSRLYRPPIS